jgi:hypothetical protein
VLPVRVRPLPADPVRLLHYGILWNVSGTGYSFDKHWHYDFDALACPPWSLRWGWQRGRQSAAPGL